MTARAPADADDRDELAWLAFRYVADELGSDEQAAFEDRLDRDQAAREAVAEAVALAAAMAVAVPAHRRQRRRHRRVLAVAALAAVCALTVALPWSRSRPGPDQAPLADETDPRKVMALAWSVLWQGNDAPIETETDSIIPLDGLIARVDETGPLDPSLADRTDELGIAPAWMVEGAYVHEMLRPRGPGS